MKEPWWSSVRRRWHELRMAITRRMIFWLIHTYDVLGYGAFMAMTYSYDEHTDYHVIAERYHEKCHVYGTKVEYYDKEEKP